MVRAVSSSREEQSRLISEIAAKRLLKASTIQRHVLDSSDHDSDDLNDWSGSGDEENQAPGASKSKVMDKVAVPARVLNRLQPTGPPKPSAATAAAKPDMEALYASLGGLQLDKTDLCDSETSEDGSDDSDAHLPSRPVSDQRPSSGVDLTIQGPPAAPLTPSEALVLKDDSGDGSCPPFVLAPAVATKLFPHQRTGLSWLWSLHLSKQGGILGDDMGLGKTMQCAAFIAGMLESGLAQRVLIVAPKTLLLHWEKELAVCGVGRLTHGFYGSSESERASSLAAVSRRGGVLLTTYGMVQHNSGQLRQAGVARCSSKLVPLKHTSLVAAAAWDMMFLDEGHKVKNPRMKLVAALQEIPVNNLMELHALFDFCCPGLLGERRTFKQHYELPITTGQDRNATPRQRQAGGAIAAELRERIAPVFLRREKKDVLQSAPSASDSGSKPAPAESSPTCEMASPATAASSSSGSGSTGSSSAAQTISRKNDLVVWLQLKPLQRHIYESFLHSEDVRAAMDQTQTALAALGVLKKVCDHPALLSKNAASNVIAGGQRWARGSQKAPAGRGKAALPKQRRGKQLDSDGDFIDDGDSDRGSEDSDDSGSSSEGGSTQRAKDSHEKQRPPPQGVQWDMSQGGIEASLLQELEHRGADASCKTAFVLAMLPVLFAEGHRTLIFSQSVVMLNILQAGVVAQGLRFCRIDGSLSKPEDRQEQVRLFQTTPGIAVFLLTSQVGGLGLTLTAADRVIIIDPAWNPSVDNQAVDRAYRIGQTRDVVVYRLITCGTVEEKIYRKQVFKGGLSRTGTEEGVQFRYFSQVELQDLFKVTDEGLASSETQRQLHALHASQRRASAQLQEHLTFLATLEGYAGISDHDLLFSTRPAEEVHTAEQGRALIGEMGAVGPARAASVRGPAQPKARAPAAGPLHDPSDLSSMMGSMRLGDPATAARRLAISKQQREVDRLESQLRTAEMTVNSARMMASLMDKGAKALAHHERCQREFAEQRARLEAMREADASADLGYVNPAPSQPPAAPPPPLTPHHNPPPPTAPRPSSTHVAPGPSAASFSSSIAAPTPAGRPQPWHQTRPPPPGNATPAAGVGAAQADVQQLAHDVHGRTGSPTWDLVPATAPVIVIVDAPILILIVSTVVVSAIITIIRDSRCSRRSRRSGRGYASGSGSAVQVRLASASSCVSSGSGSSGGGHSTRGGCAAAVVGGERVVQYGRGTAACEAMWYYPCAALDLHTAEAIK
ncbi:MAG: hypothetical protein WDW36_004779 [Sanguina aurantia]